jgi:hypothetical protein
MNKKYTTNTASLNSIVADIHILKSDKIDAKKIKLNGENLENKFGFKQEDYPKLVTRCALPEDKPWALWTDSGNLVYFNQSEKIVNGDRMFQSCEAINSVDFDFINLENGYFMFGYCSGLEHVNSNMPSLTNGERMFGDCSKLRSFTGDLSSLTNGKLMFSKCKNLEHFSADLSSLTNGNNMFTECRLNKESVLGIIKCIKEKNTSPTNVSIIIGMSEEAKNSEEVLAELNVSSGWSSAIIQGASGVTWNISHSR